MIEREDGGGNVTMTAGETWSVQDYPTAQFYRVETTDDFPYHVGGVQQDNSSVCVSAPAQRGRGAPGFYAVGGGESG